MKSASVSSAPISWIREKVFRLLVQSPNRLIKCQLVGIEAVLPNVGIALGILHFQNPLTRAVAVDVDLHRQAIACQVLSQR
jgi:hypothetical protein